MKYLVFLKLLGIFFILSCTRDPVSPTDPLPPSSALPIVYIAGDSVNGNDLPTAVYWKNDSAVVLLNNSYSSGTGIAISGNDVYVSCSGEYSGNKVTYWKNGVGVNLADATITYPTANAITVSGQDVYVAGGAYIDGFSKFIPIYWKNEEKAVHIATANYSPSYVRAVTVLRNDIYIAGATSAASIGSGNIATYWKNGVPGYLKTSNTIYGPSIANSIFVSGPDVYVAGSVNLTNGDVGPGTHAAYWKNGVPEMLTISGTSLANSITVSGNDVYVAGAIFGPDNLPRATYWKNGIAVSLESTYSVANSIAVNGTDVYVAGKKGYDKAIYWKNGQSKILGKGSARSIALKN